MTTVEWISVCQRQPRASRVPGPRLGALHEHYEVLSESSANRKLARNGLVVQDWSTKRHDPATSGFPSSALQATSGSVTAIQDHVSQLQNPAVVGQFDFHKYSAASLECARIGQVGVAWPW